MTLPIYYTNERRDILPFLPEKPIKSIEFGCGVGNFSAIIKDQLKAETWGVDINQEAVTVAKKKLDNVLLGDAIEVLKDLPEYYFDCLICNDILEHLPYPENFLQEVRRILTKNAYITCSVPNIRSWGHFIHYFFGKDWKYANYGILDNTHLKFFIKKKV